MEKTKETITEETHGSNVIKRVTQQWQRVGPSQKRFLVGYLVCSSLTFAGLQLANGWDELNARSPGKGNWRRGAVKDGFKKECGTNFWKSLWFPYYGVAEVGGVCLAAIHTKLTRPKP